MALNDDFRDPRAGERGREPTEPLPQQRPIPNRAGPAGLESSREMVSFGRRHAQLAREDPDRDAVVFLSATAAPVHISRQRLHRWSNQVARLLADHDVTRGDRVGIALPNSITHVVTALGAWKIGADALPLRADMPDWERARVLEVATPRLVVADWPSGLPCQVLPPAAIGDVDGIPDDDFDFATPEYPLTIGTGGSTGTPKLIRMPFPGALPPGHAFGVLGEALGICRPLVHIICGPLYHGNPFSMTHIGLFEGQTIVLLERFDAALAVDAIATYRVAFGTLVPTMMKRIVELPSIEQADFSSLVAILHTAAPCPESLKRAWIDLIGGERLWEAFGSSESVGYYAIRGDQWLEHPGSVGLPVRTELKIVDDEGREVPPGTVGMIYMRLAGTTAPAFEYVGHAPAPEIEGGYTSAGDLGWVDEDGYLYSADRRVDLIISGGANIVPAEVEAALIEHPAVMDAVVIGLPDPEWGARVHAIVELSPNAPAPAPQVLHQHCRERLAPYKVPKSIEIVESMPRNAMGKINRSQLVADRARVTTGEPR